MKVLLSFCLFFVSVSAFAQGPYWKVHNGEIDFVSDAPLELITASSKQAQGVIDIENRTFAFAVFVNSFQGFNSPLQQQHFNENYLESSRFPKAIFKGRIIEKIDLQSNGTFVIRAKGMLNIHGKEQERIIKSTIIIQEDTLALEATFSVPLSDHNITIPHIVNQKIAEDIQVRIKAEMQKLQKS